MMALGGKMCGNGIRCVGKYVYDYCLTDKKQVKIETLSGMKTLDLTIDNGKVSQSNSGHGKSYFSPKNSSYIR